MFAFQSQIVFLHFLNGNSQSIGADQTMKTTETFVLGQSVVTVLKTPQELNHVICTCHLVGETWVFYDEVTVETGVVGVAVLRIELNAVLSKDFFDLREYHFVGNEFVTWTAIVQVHVLAINFTHNDFTIFPVGLIGVVNEFHGKANLVKGCDCCTSF